MTHYQTLRVSDGASTEEIRDAYRRLARRHHPDRAVQRGDGGEAASMAAINEAYRVLADPGRRAVYDTALRQVGVTAGASIVVDRPFAEATPAPARSAALPPARYPWRFALAMAAIGAAVVLVGAALYEPAAERPPDNLLGPGSCVVIEVNGDAREVNCPGDDGLVVEALVGMDDRCPTGTAGHRDRQGRGLACVRSLP